MILAEQFLLIALDDESGRTPWEGTEVALGGALLIDLLRSSAVVEEDGKIVATADDPGDPLLAEARERISSSPKRRSARKWVERLPREFRPIRRWVAAPLVERGVLAEERGKLLGAFGAKRYPEADAAPERELRARLHDVLVTGAEPTEQEASLIALLRPMAMVRRVVSKDQRVAADRRAKEIADRGVGSEATRRAIQAAQAGVTAAIAAAGT
jgi:Golgi phosphoprotein 3 (GPP34)